MPGAGSADAGAGAVNTATSALLDAQSEEKLMKLLSQQTDAVRRLEEAVRRDGRDVHILENCMASS